MKRLKTILKVFLMIAMVCWSLGMPFLINVPKAQAAGFIDGQSIGTNGQYLSASSTPEAIMKITAYDTVSGTNKLNNLTVQIMPGMNCDMGGTCSESLFTISDLGSITTTANSGISVWQDDGDGTFELDQDTLVSNTTAKQASAWTTKTITDDWGSFTVIETTFSSLDLTIPVDYNAPLTVFVAARAENNIDADPMHMFMPNIPQYGVDVTSASLTDWPVEPYGRGFMQVTLGAEGSGTNMQFSSPIVISEVQYASSTPAVEFVELYNNSEQSYDLFPSNGIANADAAISADLKLHTVNDDGTVDTNKTLTLTANDDAHDDIAAKSYFLIASSDWNTAWSGSYGPANMTYDASSNGLVANGAVYISRSATSTMDMIDMVGWGTQTTSREGMAAVAPSTDGSIERKAFPSSTPTSMTIGVDANKGNGEDSNNNSADFITRSATAVYPQTTLSAPESSTIESSDRNIVINEVLYNTSSGDGWIELYNASSTAISLNNWTLEVATSTVQTYTLPNTSLSANSLFVVYWNKTGSDSATSSFSGVRADMSIFGGDITLKDNTSAIKDYFQYGGPGKAGQTAAVSAGQWTTGDYRPGSGYNESLARAGTTGDDHNTSGDWVLVTSPTVGFPNSGGDSTAPTVVTNVVLSDPDTTNFGLSGDDVRVSWTPSATSDSTFDRYEIYLLPDSTSLDTAQHMAYGTAFGQKMFENGTASSSFAFIGNPGQPDSAGAPLSPGNYRAYVVAIDMAGNRSATVGSAPAVLSSEDSSAAGADTFPPMIDHMSVWEAKVGSDLTFYARMGDDRDMCNLATAELAFKIDNASWGNATSTCAIPAMAGDSCLKACTIPWNGGWTENTIIKYYLRAIDTAGNDMYVGMFPTDNETEAKANPIDIDLIASATWNDVDSTADLSGTIINEAGTPVQDAFVYINGIAALAATTTASGTFTIPDNTMRWNWHEVKIVKTGYMDQFRNVEKNSTGNDFYLSNGFMSTSVGGSTGGNGIAWTAPMDGMMMAPTNIACTADCSTIGTGEMPIMVGFFNEMNSSTIDDVDAANTGSNIYLTSDGTTKVSGVKVKYNANNNEARIYSSTALNTNTFYTLVITPNVTDINGNPIESNRPNGNYEFSFSTMGDNTDMWIVDGSTDYTIFGGGGMYMPPYVFGTNPNPGQYNVPLSSVLTIEFSEPMDPSVTSSIKLYRVTSENPWTTTEVTDKNVTVSLDSTTKKIATITHTALDANTANKGWYEIRVMGNAKSQMGTWMGDPSSCGVVSPDVCLANTIHYTSGFQVAASSDTTAPTVSGTYPTNNDGINNSNYADVAIPAIEIGFSEGMNPNTINNKNITLKKGTVSISGTVKYDSMTNSAKFSPTNALSAGSVYTLTITTGVTDLSGNPIASNNIVSFKTGSADTSAPELMFANGDDYQIAVTFSEPMNASTQSDTTNWAYSVLNPANYFINALDAGSSCSAPGSWSCAHTAVTPYSDAPIGNQVSTLSNITLSYDGPSQTVTLKGFDMCGSNDFASCAASYYQIFVDNIKDKSGNTIADSTNRAASGTHLNATRAPLQNSADTYGMLGPGGGPGMMMGGGGPGSGGTGGGPGMDMGKMGMFGAGAFPMNAMAGQTSQYMIDLPVTKALQDGMQIILTFPAGFNVSGVAKDLYSPMNNDINESGGGTVTFDPSFGVGGVASTTNKIITLKLDIATSSNNMLNSNMGPDGFVDSLHFDLKGIINASIPKSFGTSGYTVDIKTKSADGALLESISTMPFFITEGGNDLLTVVVNSGNVAQNTGIMSVYLGSPMTGPMEANTTVFTDGIATSTFSNISSGEYMLFTDPFVTIDGTNYLGNGMPEPFTVNGTTIKTLNLEQEGAGAGKAPVGVYLLGNYSTGGVADNVDIFANSPSGFRVKTLSNVGSTNPSTTLYLTEGEWMMGVGPAMPKGPMAGPPPMPDWMQPQMLGLVVGIETATSRNLDPNTATPANVGNQEPILFNVNSTNYFKTGDTVTFGVGIASATTTISSIVTNTSITVVPQGNWTTLPSNTDTITSVRESSSGSNDSKIYFNISTQSLKNINGYVLDGSGNALSGVEVYAYQPQGFGGGNTSTDTNGRFTLKIGMNGVWTVGAFKPGIPNDVQKSIEVKDNSSNTDGNTTADVYLKSVLISDASNNNAGTNPLRLVLQRPGETISGKVLNSSGQAVPYAPVWAYQPSGWGHSDTMTDSSGNYILYVDAGTWQVEADAPGVGWMQYDTTISISTGSSQSNINLRPSSTDTFYDIRGTVTIDGSVQTYRPIRAVQYDANGNYLGREFNSSTDANGAYKITAPTGYYRVDIWTQNYGEVELVYDQVANSPANINLTAATTTADILIASSDLKTISLGFTNGTATQNGFLHIEGITTDSPPKPNGFTFSKNISGLSATSTIKLKTGHYIFFLDVPGLGSYIPTEDSRNVGSGNGDHIHVTANRDVYFALADSTSSEMITVSGTVKDDSAAALGDSFVWIGDPNSFFRIGENSASNGTFSVSIPKKASGNYQMGAEKPGYMAIAPVTVLGSADSTGNTITLTSIANNSQSISGYVKNAGGTGLANAVVWAEEVGVIGNLGTGKVIHTQADVTGAYTLPVTNGTWNVLASADGYVKSSYKVSGTRQDITISGTSQSPSGAINFALATNSEGIKSKSKPITPASGGTIDDTTQNTTTGKASGTGVKLTIPPNALGSSASTGNINAQQTSAVTKTNSSQPFKNQGTVVTATDNSGQAITNLDDNIDIQMIIYKADVDVEIANGDLTYAMLKNTNNGYWDATSNNWVNLTTTRTAYYKTVSSPNEWILYVNASSTNPFGTFIDSISAGTIAVTDYKLVFTSQTDHFTVFAVIMPFIITAAQAAPSTPITPTPTTTTGGTSPTVTYCTNVEFYDWQETCNDGWRYRSISSQSPSNCTLTTTQESERISTCIPQEQTESLVEKIIEGAKDVIKGITSGISDKAKSFAEKITEIASEASEMAKGNISSLLSKFGFKRDLAKEQVSVNKYVKNLIKDATGLAKESQYALTNFIAYGTDTTQILGEGERAGVVNSFKSALGKLPTSEEDWNDVIKIANGRWPAQTNAETEANAEEAFKKIYLRNSDRTNPNDDAAVIVMAYGLRPADRNLNSEKTAIKTFRHIYGYDPVSATAWDIVRAIAYSGATR